MAETPDSPDTPDGPERSERPGRPDQRSRRERAEAVRLAQARKERNRRLGLVAAVVAVVVVLATALVWAQARRDPTSTASAGSGSSAVGATTLALGKKSAPVKVTIYEDFQCPFCQEFESASRDFLKADAEAGKAYVEYRPIAFLNDYSERSLGAFAEVLKTEGSSAALDFHNALYDNQPSEQGPALSDSQLGELAARSGASASVVEKAIRAETFKQAIADASDVASKAGVNGTPTILVNGTVLPSGSTMQETVEALESRIAQG